MDFHIKDVLNIYKPRQMTPKDVRSWQMKFFRSLEPSWNSYHKDPLEINMVRGWLKRFNKDMLPIIYAECEKGNFSKNFWWKWGKMPPYVAPKKPKNLTLKMK